MNVLRQVCKKSRRIRPVAMIASISAFWTVLNDFSVYSEESITMSREVPGGRRGVSSSMARRTPSTTVTVLASASLVTTSASPSWPFTRTIASRFLYVSSIFATSRRRTAPAWVCITTRSPSCSGDCASESK